LMFVTDFERATAGAESFDECAFLNPTRTGVLVEMVFQMGVAGVAEFKNFLAAIRSRDWDTAANEMLDSKWAKQTPERANALSEIFRHG